MIRKPDLLPVPAKILHYMVYVIYLDTFHFVVKIDTLNAKLILMIIVCLG